MFDRLVRRSAALTLARTPRPAPRPCPLGPLERLEGREVPAVLIQLDYSRDVGGFFNNAEARATLEQVAAELGNSLTAHLAAIAPGGGNTWTATFVDPATGGQMALANLSVAANTIVVFVGARAMGGAEAGFAATAGHAASGSQAWVSGVQTRGHSGFAPWGGSIAFDTARNWHFGSTTAGLDGGELDFYSIAAHELGHVLGIGTAPQWNALVQGGAFRGAGATGVYGGPVPLSADGDHWADGITIGGRSVSLDPSLTYGQRVGLSALDTAALGDLGWNAGPGAAPAAAAAPAPVAWVLVPVAGANGAVTQYAVGGGTVVPTGRVFVPFPGYRGALHQAIADFDGDGAFDVAVATANAGVGVMTVISGTDGRYLTAPRLTFGTVAAMVAADINGDGHPDLITGEGTPMGIYVFDVSRSGIAPNAGFAAHGVPGRAAVRVETAAPAGLAPAPSDPTGDFEPTTPPAVRRPPAAPPTEPPVPDAAPQATDFGAAGTSDGDDPLTIADLWPDDSDVAEPEEGEASAA